MFSPEIVNLMMFFFGFSTATLLICCCCDPNRNNEYDDELHEIIERYQRERILDQHVEAQVVARTRSTPSAPPLQEAFIVDV